MGDESQLRTKVKLCNSHENFFAGMTLSSTFWGTLADKFGRKPILVVTSVFLCYFGILTAFSPSFNWVLFLRFMVGFFIGAIPQVS